MMKFARSRSRGAYYVNPPQGDILGREVADPLVKDEKGFTFLEYKQTFDLQVDIL